MSFFDYSNQYDYPIFFELDGANYVQSLVKYGEYKKWQQ